MAWRDDLGVVEFPTPQGRVRAVGATFRGVPFYVETAEQSGGRRGVTHTYPFRDEPFREDLGRAPRSFPVEGYVLGDDYVQQRNALLAALEEEGPGELRHPYFGTLQVAAVNFKVRETIAAGGIARFSVEFEQTPAAPSQPVAAPDSAARVTASAAAAREAVSAEFLAAYAPGLKTAAMQETLRRIAVAAPVSVATAEEEVQAAARMRRQIDETLAAVVALVSEPAGLLAAVTELFDGFSVLDALLDLYAVEHETLPAPFTSNREVEQANTLVLRRTSQRLAAVRAAEVLLTEEFQSYEAARAARDSVTDLLDEQVESVNQDATYAALVQLRADVVTAVPGEDSDLPRLLTYTPVESTPSLVVAHEVYGDVSRELEIVARNRVPNPAAIVGGAVLEVLSDA